jgi:hypothetical protein
MSDDAIQRYLRELRAALASPLPSFLPRGRRLLHEAEAHLREAEAREQAAGASPPLAADRAIRRFGSPGEVAAAARAARPRIPRGATAVVVSVFALGAGIAGSAGAAGHDQPVTRPSTTTPDPTACGPSDATLRTRSRTCHATLVPPRTMNRR